MKTPRAALSGLLLLLGTAGPALAGGPPFSGGRWIDLTHDFSTNTIYWPTAQGFALETEFKGMTAQGYFYAANRYHASEHGGTHIDAPMHFAEGRKTVDQLSIDRLTGASVVVDVSTRALQDADYLSMAARINPTAVQQIINSVAAKVLWEYPAPGGDPRYVRLQIHL